MSDLSIEHWAVSDLIEYARNPRKNDVAVDRMVAAIKEFGFRIPIIAKSDGLIVDGHLRLKAAKKLGLTEVPVLLADDLTETQIKAFRLLANKSVSWAEWDYEMLALELQELDTGEIDMSLTGFSDEELERIGTFAPGYGNGLTDPDETPETPIEPITVAGDVWIMGRHRLLCGDSTVATDVEKVLANNSSAGQAVYDPFVGSGTTIIAAEQTGRCCLAIDVSPAYVDVSVLRWQAFTGKNAVLESDGRSFDEVKAERQPELEAA